jgi:hypothetical protein
VAYRVDGPTDAVGWEDSGPFWGARAYPPKTGLDHLGLASVSQDHILPMLSPGINVLTPHPRYWSFYLLVLDEFWRRPLPRTAASFRAFFRPREATFSMACHVCEAGEGHEALGGGIVGANKISPLAEDQTFDPPKVAIDYMKSDLGGYGLYYRTAMESTGVLLMARPGGGFLVDVPTPRGQAIAAAYRDAVADTALWQRHLSQDLQRPIDRNDLVHFARVGCLCQLPQANNADLPLLQDLFLHEPSDRAQQRRDTMRFFLDLGRTYSSLALDQPKFRRLVYFHRLDGVSYEPHPDLRQTARYWRLLQAREYFAYALNRLLEWVRANGAGDRSVATRAASDLDHLLEEALDSNTLGETLGGQVTASTPATRLVALLTERVQVTSTIDEPWLEHEELDEGSLYMGTLRALHDGDALVRLLAMILLIHRRLGTPDRLLALDPTSQGLLRQGGSIRVGMDQFFRELTQRLGAEQTLGELARWIVSTRIVTQHERVAVAKLPDDTFRIRRIGDMIRFFDKDASSPMNDSRFNALSKMVHELGLVTDFQQAGRAMSPAGARLLADGDLPAGALDVAASQYEHMAAST